MRRLPTAARRRQPRGTSFCSHESTWDCNNTPNTLHSNFHLPTALRLPGTPCLCRPHASSSSDPVFNRARHERDAQSAPPRARLDRPRAAPSPQHRDPNSLRKHTLEDLEGRIALHPVVSRPSLRMLQLSWSHPRNQDFNEFWQPPTSFGHRLRLSFGHRVCVQTNRRNNPKTTCTQNTPGLNLPKD